MTLARQAYIFRDGDQINPDDVNRAEESVNTDWWKTLDRRYFHSQFRIPLDNMAYNDAAVLRTYTIDVDLEFKIRKVELFINETSTEGATHTLTLSGSGIDTQTITLTGRTSAAQTAYVSTDMAVDVPLSTTLSVAWSGTGTVALGKAYAVIHIVTDRQTAGGQTETGTAAFAAQDLKSGATMTASAFTTIQSSINNQEQQERGRYWACAISLLSAFHSGSGIAWTSGAQNHTKLPAGKLTFGKAKAYSVTDVGRTLTARVLDQSVSLVDSASLVGAGSTTEVAADLAPAAGYGQSTHDPEDSADDWVVDFSSTGGGTIYKHYYVIAFI